MKDFVDNNLEFDENSKNFSEWIENTVEKGAIAHYEQFLLFPQFFQKRHVKTRACLGKGLIFLTHCGEKILVFYKRILKCIIITLVTS